MYATWVHSINIWLGILTVLALLPQNGIMKLDAMCMKWLPGASLVYNADMN